MLGNRDLLKRNVNELLKQLESCDEYVSDVINGKQESNQEAAQLLDKCLRQFSVEDLASLRMIVKENFDVGVIISNLAKLQRAQLMIFENLSKF